jgi:hypothetical protein
MQKDIPQITLPERCDRKNRSKLFLNLGVLISFCIVLLLTYFPVVQINYLYMEDYIFVNSQEEHSLLNLLVSETIAGKSLYGIFYYLIANYFEHANSIRLLGIISLGLLAYIIYKFLKTYLIKSEHSFLISILVCTLPAFQIYVAWTVCVPYIYSAILSVLAGVLFFNVVMNKNTRRFIQVATFFIIVFLLVIAMYIYQPTAMLYWAVSIIPL